MRILSERERNDMRAMANRKVDRPEPLPVPSSKLVGNTAGPLPIPGHGPVQNRHRQEGPGRPEPLPVPGKEVP